MRRFDARLGSKSLRLASRERMKLQGPGLTDLGYWMSAAIDRDHDKELLTRQTSPLHHMKVERLCILSEIIEGL